VLFRSFRYFDAAKPGPVAWAVRLLDHHPKAWVRAAGILLDDLVAAGCTLLSLAVGVAVWEAWG
jgi:phosphatidylglycerophosphatase A